MPKVVACSANNGFFWSFTSQGAASPESSLDCEAELEASFEVLIASLPLAKLQYDVTGT